MSKYYCGKCMKIWKTEGKDRMVIPRLCPQHRTQMFNNPLGMFRAKQEREKKP